MRIRHTYLNAMLAASAALASTLVAAPPAAADCISASGPHPLTLCSSSGGESRQSNTSPVPTATPYIPYDCDVDWTCGSGLGIALGD